MLAYSFVQKEEVQLTFRQWREHYGITFEELRKATRYYITLEELRLLDEDGYANPYILDIALSTVSCMARLPLPLKRSQLAGFTFILATGNRKQPLHSEIGPLPEHPRIYQIIEYYNLKYGYVLAAADLPNEVVYCVFFGKPARRHYVEKVLKLISAYVGKIYTIEMIKATLLPDISAEEMVTWG